MNQHEKLFSTAEVEYITPFLKLWMAFNSWYKKTEDFKQDRDAINYFKTAGKIKDAFLDMLNSRAAKYANFQEAVADFITVARQNQHEIETLFWNQESNYLHDSPSSNDIKNNALEYIAEQNKALYISPEYKDDFFHDVLENVYQVRCSLVHGDFNIENEHFIDLVKCAYSLLYPVMQKVFAEEKHRTWHCQNNKGTDAQGLYGDNATMKVLTGSRIRKGTVTSYKDVNKRQSLLEENARLENSVYVLKRNIEFESVSAASSFCLGSPSNGWNDWKDQQGQTLNAVLRDKSL